MYDLIIIGAGPAGITASVYAARKTMNFLVITKEIGGQTALSGNVENYTGYQFIPGIELANKFNEHMSKYAVTVKEDQQVTEVIKQDEVILVKTHKEEFRARAVIIASGATWKELGVPGEKEFKNKGLTYCATCDGPIFAGKNVAIIGGGNSALDAALQLVKIASHVYVINIASALTGDSIMIKKAKLNKNFTVMDDSQVVAIYGDSMVRGVKVKKKNSQEEDIAVEGVFVEIGFIPNSGFVKDVIKNGKQEIVVDCDNNTNTPGIFAAGDVTNVSEKQIIVAAGEGAKAALSAFKYFNKSGL